METVMCTQNINSLFASLGCPIGDEYIVGDDCQVTLKKILRNLYDEDKYVRGFRRLIANSQVLKKDLLPLFYNSKQDHSILDLIIEILENLMIPVECLFPIDIMIKEDAGRSTIFNLNWLLTACKEAFLNPCATKSVIDYIKFNMTKEHQRLTGEGCRRLDLSLRLLRNLLHIPEVRGGAPGGGASHQNQIVWNLFTQHFDRVLIQLMTCKSRGLWCLTVVQLISLLFKDQNNNTLHRLLNTWCDTAPSDSSEDNESNTSPRDQGSNDSSSSMATSEMNSDSSSDCDQQKRKKRFKSDAKYNANPMQNRMTEIKVNGKVRKAQVAMRNKHGSSSKNSHHVKHRQSDHSHSHDQHYTSSKGNRAGYTSESGLGSSVNGSSKAGSVRVDNCYSDMSDFGISSQNQETMSTSSNEGEEPCRYIKKKPVHQKPLNMVQKMRYKPAKTPLTSQARKDLLRDKLKKRSKSTTVSMKTFMNHVPTGQDISHVMKEFTVDFLLKGYGPLINELKKIVFNNKDVNLDTSHFTWLIMFFLKFACQLEIDLDKISPVLSYDVVSYLTYEGVNLCEELEVRKLEAGENLNRTLRKLYLVVSSLKEIIFAIQCYKKISHLTPAEKEYIRKLQENITQTHDLKFLFILLLRHFDPGVLSQQFLQDVIVANHSFIVLMEGCPQVSKEALAEHINQFAAQDVISQYGILLTCYEDNGEMVNNCIFTMMHHIAGDLDKVSLLFQPSILRTFSQILDSDFQICDEWSDLLRFVVQKCLKTKQIKVPSILTASFHQDDFKVPEPVPSDITPTPSEDPPTEHLKIKHMAVQLISEVSESRILLGGRWSREDIESLCWFFPQSMEMPDPVGHISKMFLENTGVSKSRIEIIENLFKQGFIQEDVYKVLREKEPQMEKPDAILNKERSSGMDIIEGIQAILEYLHGANCGFFVKWLQNCLLETCYAKIVMRAPKKPKNSLVEPVANFYTKLGQPVPLVTWTQDLWKVMQLEPSIWLLSALNFHLPSRAGEAKIFARIPSEWTTDHLYVAALILGSLNSKIVKFDPSTLQVIKHSDPSTSSTAVPMDQSAQTYIKSSSSLFGYFTGSSSTAEWLQKVQTLKTSNKLQPLEDKLERMSVTSGDERDWDLTSMCVSDEFARQDDALSCNSTS